MQRVAVVLMNLGGPDRPDSVRPFLFNLFNDRAIVGLPALPRRLLAWLISARRAPVARAIYARLGGGSPLLANTRAQADALERALGARYRAFVAMRYWHPRSDETARAVQEWNPDRLVLLPLYPQYSTTTAGSSLADWRGAGDAAGLSALPATAVCCYPTAEGLVSALAELIRPRLAEAAQSGRPRLLLTAHGLPQKVVRRGDPYQWQVEQTAARVVAALDMPGLDWRLCYQSRVGPLAWIEPATDDEIRRAGRDGVPVVVAPIAFVSEHSETLVELDMEYAHLASACGVPAFIRVPTVSTSPAFIGALASIVRAAVEEPACLYGERRCPAACGACPQRVPAATRGMPG